MEKKGRYSELLEVWRIVKQLVSPDEARPKPDIEFLSYPYESLFRTMFIPVASVVVMIFTAFI